MYTVHESNGKSARQELLPLLKLEPCHLENGGIKCPESVVFDWPWQALRTGLGALSLCCI